MHSYALLPSRSNLNHRIIGMFDPGCSTEVFFLHRKKAYSIESNLSSIYIISSTIYMNKKFIFCRVAEAVGANARTVIRWEQGQTLPYQVAP